MNDRKNVLLNPNFIKNNDDYDYHKNNDSNNDNYSNDDIDNKDNDFFGDFKAELEPDLESGANWDFFVAHFLGCVILYY